jgi:hypothetical protein
MIETVECKSIFSNGTEYVWFLEHFCWNCTRFRKGRCRIYNAIEDARFDVSRFPYADLMDYKNGYAGKVCKSFTTERQRFNRNNKVAANQMTLEIGGAESSQRK